MTIKKLNNPKDLENARVKYSAVLSLKASEGDIQWSRYNAMLVVNTIIVGFIGFAYNREFDFPFFFNILFWFTPLLGLLLCYAWHQMTKRGFMWTKFWMDTAYRIEGQIDGDINPVQEGRELRDTIGEGVTKRASLRIINFFAVIYTLIFIFNLLYLP